MAALIRAKHTTTMGSHFNMVAFIFKQPLFSTICGYPNKCWRRYGYLLQHHMWIPKQVLEEIWLSLLQ
jgi:hypothetical protein